MSSECCLQNSPLKSRNEPNLALNQKETQSNQQITAFNEIGADEQQCPLNRISLVEDPSLVSIQEIEEQKLYPFTHGERTCFLLRFFFFHQTLYSYFLKKNVLDKGLKIEEKHLPRLSASEDITSTVALTLNATNQLEVISCWQLIKIAFFGQLRSLTCICFTAYAIESISRCGISLAISELINNVLNGHQSYLLGAGLAFLNLVCILCRHHGFNSAMVFSSKSRMTLINLVFIKLTEQTSFSIKQANIGKILNLISGDINYLENEFIVIFQSSAVLITVTLGCYILWHRFGSVIGLLALVIIFVAYPIQIGLQSFNSETLKQAKFFQDQRLKLTNELIEGIRLVKMYAWEKAFQQMINIARRQEFLHYLKISLRIATDRVFSLISQIWASYIFFVILYYGGYREEMSVAEMVSTIQFLSFFKQRCVFIVSQGIKAIITAKVSFERITHVLNMQNCNMKQIKDQKQIDIIQESNHSPIIQLNNFTSYWTSDVTDETKPMLKNITLSINEGESWAFIGRIGCGKSTLLNALLFEIPAYKGSIKINGKEADKGKLKIAYVEQEPFIFPDTIRNNIIFGRSFNKILYQKVLHASQLETDLNLMKFQDHTEIGERGTTLSGGQKARISLARALYQQADLYLFDDPLSAVDSHVAKNIFHMAIQEFIFEEQIKMNPHRQKPIVILATHQIQFAIKFDKIAILNEGELLATGSYEEIKTKLNMINEELAKQLNLSNESQKFIRPIFSKRTKILSNKKKNLTGNESDHQEKVNLKTYMRYAKSQSYLAILLVLILQVGSEAITNLYQRIIALFQQFQKEGEIDYAYKILGLFLLGIIFLNFLKYLINTLSIQRSVQKMHQNMLMHVTQAPPEYFDVNSSGRIINRFSNDLSLCDNLTNQVSMDIIETIGNFFISLVTLAILEKYFIIPIVFVLLVNFYQFSYSKQVISQLREIELMARSPLFDFLKKTVSGVTQMKIYDKQEWFRQQFFDLSNKCNLISLTYYYSTRCFGFNIDLIGYLAQTVGIFLFITLSSDNIAVFSQGILLLITYNDTFQLGLIKTIQFQTIMSSYNRIFQIIDIKPEAPHFLPQDLNYSQFPLNGNVTFSNVHMRYRQNTDLVLKGLSFKIKSGEKIGCVGRTGSGKSSILQAIFRMAEIEQDDNSKIEIGDIDIKTLGLHKLRNSIGIIPQSPFLFTGSIRRNLDPFDQYDDQTLWKSLEDTDLIQYIKQLKKGLLTDMSDVNSIFSVGQKQLICLARVILQQKKIIVLDEATANVDMKTDDFIQDTLKRKFNNCTLITIAHRLNTIADYDKVMVINDGKVLEYDQPFNLLAQSIESNQIDKITEFSKLVKNTGDQNAQAIFDIAKQKVFQKME